MSFFHRFAGHLKTVIRHKRLVRQHCWKCGLYRQGIFHDMTKFSLSEFPTSVHYYSNGKRSPNEAERRDKGYSSAWLHHKGRNKHHIEYWTDYVPGKGFTGVPMPFNYLVESICDRVSASQVYNGADYTQKDPYLFFLRSKLRVFIHPDTLAQFDYYFKVLADQGENALHQTLRADLKEWQRIRKSPNNKKLHENELYPMIWREKQEHKKQLQEKI